jgi:hypothetical protein
MRLNRYLNEDITEGFASGIDSTGSRGPTAGPTSAIDGMSKQKAKTFLYKGTKKFWYNKMYHDEYWQGPKSIWKKFDEWDLNWSIDSSRYRKPGPNSAMDPMIDTSKEWLFTIWLINNKDKQIKLHGQLIASGAGSVSDPLEKYDIILIIQ